MMKKNIVILGSKGMLGQALTELFSASEGYAVLAWDKEELDVTHFAELEKRLSAESPAIVINAAAYNAVDDCEENEEEYQKALTLNRDLPGKLAELSHRLGFLLVHYSTDYVFSGNIADTDGVGCGSGVCCGGNCHGTTENGYREDAMPNPISCYGTSKYFGEEAVRKTAKQYYLIRSSKLFGKPATSAGGKKSFFATMLELGKKNAEVKGIDDEKSCFTYAPDLAQATQALIEDGAPSGLYHLMNTGGATWYDGIVELYRQAGLATKVLAVTAEDFSPRAAKRPRYSVLRNTKRPPLRPYQEALGDFLKSMPGSEISTKSTQGSIET